MRILLTLGIILIAVRSSVSSTYLERKAARFKRFLNIPETLTDVAHHVTSAVKDIPEGVKRFLGWGAHNAKGHDSAGSSTITDSAVSKEKGQWNLLGRDWIKRIGKAVDSLGNKLGLTTSGGLDTNKKFFDGHGSLNFINRVKAIVPGTHFCGQGDIAEGTRELGYFSDTDRCCREHDGCEDYILPGNISHGLENSGLFTRSRCDCDMRFYYCLKKVDGVIATQLGITFFNVLGPQCFKVDYPIKTCRKSSWGRCVTYELDNNQPKRLQWFDNLIY